MKNEVKNNKYTTEKIPRYKQLENKIKEYIANGIYTVGDKLPTEKMLCEQFGISRATVRRALIELEKQKIISSQQGSGIYIKSYLFQQTLKCFYSFSQEMRNIGKVPSNKIIKFETSSATELVSQKLNIKKESAVLKIIRIRLADNEPYMYATTYLPQHIVPHLTKEQFENHDLYELMRTQYNIIFTKAVESFSAVLSNKKISNYLTIANNSACIHLTRQAYGLHQIVEYTESIARGDKFHFSVDLPV